MIYNQEKADRVISFIKQYCTHTKGKWAGNPFNLVPWELDVINQTFGTLKEDGNRQYRFVYIEVPKKNGKTEMSAAIGLNQLCNDINPITGGPEMGAEVYSAAADREQAGLVYNAANIMVQSNETLSRRLKVLESRKRIVDPETNSFYQVLSSEAFTKHGLNPSTIIFDELHAQPNDELWTVLTSGSDYAREQQLVIVITTAGIFDPESVWWRERDRAIKIRDGIIKDDTFLPILYIAEKDDDPADEKLWERVNPSLNQIFTLDKIRDEYNRIKDNPIELNNFKRFRLNIPAQSAAQWMPVDKWDSCDKEIIEEDLKGRTCYTGLDLSSTVDLTALIHVFPPKEEDGIYDVLCRFFIPENNIQRRVERDRVPYNVWIEEGHIIPTPGNSVDYRFIIDSLMKDAESFDIKEVAFDDWGATWVINELQELGFEEEGNKYSARHLIKFRQGFKSFSPPMKELFNLIISQRIAHGGNPVLRWNANNVYAEIDPAENIKPSKGKSTDRIDGIVGLIMGIDRAIRNANQGKSIYEEQGIMTL